MPRFIVCVCLYILQSFVLFHLMKWPFGIRAEYVRSYSMSSGYHISSSFPSTFFFRVRLLYVYMERKKNGTFNLLMEQYIECCIIIVGRIKSWCLHYHIGDWLCRKRSRFPIAWAPRVRENLYTQNQWQSSGVRAYTRDGCGAATMYWRRTCARGKDAEHIYFTKFIDFFRRPHLYATFVYDVRICFTVFVRPEEVDVIWTGAHAQ